MARNLSVQEIARRYLDNAKNAGASYKAGVQSVTENPCAKAADSADAYRAGCMAAAESGKFAERTRAVSLTAWKEAALKKGGDRYAEGVQQGAPKMAAFLADFIPQVRQMQAEVDGMPKTTKQDRKARMNAMFDRLSEYSYRGGSR